MGRKKRKSSAASYFRALYEEHPEWLDIKSNQQMLDQWEKDHNGREMSKKDRQSMANMKSMMRRKATGTAPAPRAKGARKAPAQADPADLDKLERMIDECLATARSLEVIKGVSDVARYLRRARNTFILMFDQGE